MVTIAPDEVMTARARVSNDWHCACSNSNCAPMNSAITPSARASVGAADSGSAGAGEVGEVEGEA
jgi:hypothetical protein